MKVDSFVTGTKYWALSVYGKFCSSFSGSSWGRGLRLSKAEPLSDPALDRGGAEGAP